MNVDTQLRAEESVVGGLMLDSSKWIEVKSIVSSNDFTDSRARIVFNAISEQLNNGQPADILTLTDFKNMDLAYVATLVKNTPSAANVMAYAQMIRNFSDKKQFIATAKNLVDDVERGDKSIDDAISGIASVSKFAVNNNANERALTHPYPIFDKSNFYGLAADVVELATDGSEADPIAVYISFLVGMSALLGRYKYVRIGETKHTSRLFTVLVGASSRARKGTSFKPVKKIIRKTEALYKQRYKIELPEQELKIADGGLSSAEGLIYAVRDESTDAKKNGEPQWDEVIDKRILVVEEEFSNVLKMTQRDGNTLSATLRRAWDGGTLAPMTKNNKLCATNPHIALLAPHYPR